MHFPSCFSWAWHCLVPRPQINGTLFSDYIQSNRA
jgi:hypothetical protein